MLTGEPMIGPVPRRLVDDAARTAVKRHQPLNFADAAQLFGGSIDWHRAALEDLQRRALARPRTPT
jgi:hypothetical protein